MERFGGDRRRMCKGTESVGLTRGLCSTKNRETVLEKDGSRRRDGRRGK